MPRLRHEPLIALSCRGRQSEIRPALEAVRAAVASHLASCEAGMLDSVEIALAEVLNNIVEHAAPSDTRGAIRISACGLMHALAVCISDDGRPMPGLCLPAGALRDLSVPLGDLPEGGFGWGLVRALSSGLRYRRRLGRNELAMCFLCLSGEGRGIPAAGAAPKSPN
ncbi:ATP-binding protein [Rhodosalinus sp.]|uniref:ATP-binding protein n=1 Tax=Rhodosalinus sp. TaxID=2047741 RepID=UPI00397BAC16